MSPFSLARSSILSGPSAINSGIGNGNALVSFIMSEKIQMVRD